MPGAHVPVCSPVLMDWRLQLLIVVAEQGGPQILVLTPQVPSCLQS